MADIGHNIGGKDERLASIVNRIERLTEEKAGITADIADIMKEAASAGYDKPAIRALLKKRKEDEAKRAERERLVALYEAALGPLDGTPLGAAAMARVAS